nr:hypothetical protein Iba_chr08fCG2570 [Ipomoea batatas]
MNCFTFPSCFEIQSDPSTRLRLELRTLETSLQRSTRTSHANFAETVESSFMDDGLEKYDSGKGDWDDGGQSAMISETVPLRRFKETEQIDSTVFRDFGETRFSDVIESREDFIAENSLAEEKSFHRDCDTALPIQNLPLQYFPVHFLNLRRTEFLNSQMIQRSGIEIPATLSRTSPSSCGESPSESGIVDFEDVLEDLADTLRIRRMRNGEPHCALQVIDAAEELLRLHRTVPEEVRYSGESGGGLNVPFSDHRFDGHDGVSQ